VCGRTTWSSAIYTCLSRLPRPRAGPRVTYIPDLMVRPSKFEPSSVVVRLICVQVHSRQGIQKETAALCEAIGDILEFHNGGHRFG
jgi:hypothetical protein